MDEQPTIPGLPVPPQEVWREHTAERWLRDDPASYAECVEAVRRGELNKSELAERFGKSRNSVQALVMREFSVEQLREITAKRAMIAAGESMVKVDELIPSATVKDLGGVAMAGQIAFGIAQLGSGGPTEIVETRHVLTVDEFADYVESIPVRDVTPLETGSGGGKDLAMGAAAPALPAPQALSGMPPLEAETQTVDLQRLAPLIILLFIPFCELLSAVFEGGGRGVGGGGAAAPYIGRVSQNF